MLLEWAALCCIIVYNQLYTTLSHVGMLFTTVCISQCVLSIQSVICVFKYNFICCPDICVVYGMCAA